MIIILPEDTISARTVWLAVPLCFGSSTKTFDRNTLTECCNLPTCESQILTQPKQYLNYVSRNKMYVNNPAHG